jgi:hypothetical protein
MDDPMLFAGRRDQIEELCRGLHSSGSCPIVLGDRGLGKTSLALQLRHISIGDVSLLQDYGLEDWAFAEEASFATLYIQCTDGVDGLSGLLQRMINSLVDLAVTADLRGSSVLVERTTSFRVSLKVIEAGFGSKYNPAQLYSDYESLHLEEIVVRLASHLSEALHQPILFIIDEIDRLDTDGLASFIKATSSDWLRFCLVGIGQNMSDLFADHSSIERTVWPVAVPRMSPNELTNIIEQAEERLESDGVSLSFDRWAKNRLQSAAGGFPWFVHLLGQEAAVSVAQSSRKVVEERHVEAAIRRLSTNRFAQHFSDQYQMAVRDSLHREYVLRSFASWSDADIPTSEVYKLARRLGVSNPSVYRGHLVQAGYGQVLIVPQFQNRGLVRFQNEMFKIYVRLRSSLYLGVKTEVEAAANELFR